LIALDQIRAAAQRLRGLAVRTPLVRLPLEDAPAEIYLKLENLQPIGSFKIRGAGNALRSASRESLARGVYTASAGNMAQGVAWVARELGVACDVVVPDHAPGTKLEAITRLGGRWHKVTFDEWWRVFQEHRFPGMEGKFVHPVDDVDVQTGNGTIGLEIVEDLPDVDAVVVPFGGGGLITGIGSAIKQLRPKARVYAAEVDTAAPLAASLAAGRASSIDYRASFVDGIGGKSVLPEMFAPVREVVDESIVVPLRAVADAVRLLIERARVVAEGAGAASVAAALTGRAGAGKVVCVVSGGNIDTGKLAAILRGEIP